MEKLLEGKVALVTGASSGIGKAIAIAFAREGADVAVTYNTGSERVEEVEDAIKKLGREALAVRVDVRNDEDVEKMVSATVQKFGRIDIFVNNAGIWKLSPFSEDSEWLEMLEVDLIGGMRCLKRIVQQMKEQNSGNIINIASLSGLVGQTGVASYSAAKGGLVSLTRALAKELGPMNIRVNAIAPGVIDTPAVRKYYDDFAIKRFEAGVPLKRIGKPEDVANAALFLASALSSYVTGTTIVVDGGRFA